MRRSRSSTSDTLAVRRRPADRGRCHAKTRPVTSRLMLLDTASLYFRAFFGVPDSFRAPDGTPVNAVRGLLDFIPGWSATTSRPTWRAAGTTTGGPQWRVDLIPSYKAHRVEYVVAGGPGRRGGARPARGAGAGDPRRARGLRDRGRRRRRLRGRRRDRHAGHGRRDAGRHRHRGPRPVPARRRRRARCGSSTSPAASAGTSGSPTPSYGRSTASTAGSTPTSRPCAATPPTGCPGVDGVGEKTAATLLQRFGDIPGLLAAAADPDSEHRAGPAPQDLGRGRLPRGGAARSSRVARDIDLGDARPHAAAHPGRPRRAGRAVREVEPRQPDRPPRRDPHRPPLTRGSGVDPGSARVAGSTRRRTE